MQMMERAAGGPEHLANNAQRLHMALGVLASCAAIVLLPPITTTTAEAASKKPVPTLTGEKRFLGAAVTARYFSMPGYKEAFVRYFDALTPENELKWEFLQPKPGNYNFSQADAVVNFGLVHNKQVHGHSLIFPAQDPWHIKRFMATCRDGINDAAERQDLLRKMNTHIITVMKHNLGRIKTWDVVNEAATLSGNVYYKCLWPEYDYVYLAFKTAHDVDPEAELYLSEFNAELPSINGKPNPRYDYLQNQVNTLQSKGAALTGISLQAHGNSGWAGQMSVIGETIDTYTKQGLKVRLSEFDVTRSSLVPELLDIKAQASTQRGIGKICGRRPGCVGITAWGVADPFSWLTGSNLLLDDSFKPKPAYYQVREGLTYSLPSRRPAQKAGKKK